MKQKVVWFVGHKDHYNLGCVTQSRNLTGYLKKDFDVHNVWFDFPIKFFFPYTHFILPFTYRKILRDPKIIKMLPDESWAYLLSKNTKNTYLLAHHIPENKHETNIVSRVRNFLILRWFKRLKFAKHVFCVSEIALDDYSKQTNAKSLSLLYDSFDTSKFTSTISKQELFDMFNVDPRLQGKKIVLFVGSFESRKNTLVIPEFLKGMEDVLFVRVGPKSPGEIYEKFKEKMEQYKIPYLDTDILDIFPLADWYAHADCVVFPSKYEGFGRPLIEGQLSNTPVVCTKIRAFECIAPKDTVLWVEDIHDVKKWRTQVRKAFDLKKDKKFLAKARKNGMKLDIATVGKELAAVFNGKRPKTLIKK